MKLKFSRWLKDWINQGGLDRRDVVRLMRCRETKGLRNLDRWLRGDSWPLGDQIACLAEALPVPASAIREVIRLDQRVLRDEARKVRAQDSRFHLFHKWLHIDTFPMGTSLGEAKAQTEQLSKAHRAKFYLNAADGKHHFYSLDSGNWCVCGDDLSR